MKALHRVDRFKQLDKTIGNDASATKAQCIIQLLAAPKQHEHELSPVAIRTAQTRVITRHHLLSRNSEPR